MSLMELRSNSWSKNLYRVSLRKIVLLSSFFCWTLVSCQSKAVTFLTSDSIQLAPPKIVADSVLFKKSTGLSIHLNEEGSVIRYTLDGSEVVENSQVYKEPLKITSTTRIKVKAYHPQYRSSEIQSLEVRRIQEDMSSAEVSVTPDPNSNYAGNGSATLVDGRRGALNFRAGKNWLGFQEPNITINLMLSKETEMENVVVSVLRDQDSWIFSPKSIQVISEGNAIGQLTVSGSTEPGSKKLQFLTVPIEKGSYKELTITISPIDQIPDWHAGKGTSSWVFIDEIMVE